MELEGLIIHFWNAKNVPILLLGSNSSLRPYNLIFQCQTWYFMPSCAVPKRTPCPPLQNNNSPLAPERTAPPTWYLTPSLFAMECLELLVLSKLSHPRAVGRRARNPHLVQVLTHFLFSNYFNTLQHNLHFDRRAEKWKIWVTYRFIETN